ncbi:MAG: response regulator [Mycobacteriales bacterium]
MPNRVLVVEDDPSIRASLAMALEDEGYEVAVAADGEEALQQLGARGSDVVLVDLMLPGIDGFELTRRIRRGSDVPIIVVSARSDTHDIVAGLEAGADDYITKPFVVPELAARLRALRRRADSADSEGDTTVDLGDLVIRPEEGTATLAGDPVHLTKTEFRLLCHLAERLGKVSSREQLLEAVWEYGYFADSRIVDVHVRRLRAKIEIDPANPRHLLTARGLGYKLVR